MRALMKHLLFFIPLLMLASMAQAAIDPTKVQKLVAGDGAWFGYSVALSADGNTALIGDILVNSEKGAAYVFTRSDSGWTQQAKLTDPNGGIEDTFGSSVSLSADGNTALIGASSNVSSSIHKPGMAYIFTRSGSSWMQQAKLNDPDGVDGDAFGCAVSLSADGSTALIGASSSIAYNNGKPGAAYVFTRSGSSWMQNVKLTASNCAAGAAFGGAVALSADGGTALIGASWKGSAYIFTHSSSKWTQQAELTDFYMGGSRFGLAVSLSANGDTALVSAGGDDGAKGAAYIFTRSSSSWTQQAKLIAADATYDDWFGNSVSLSADGNTALIGASWKDDKGGESGAAYVFTRFGSSWPQKKLTIADVQAYDYFGCGVSLTADGNTALIGERGVFKGDGGSVYVFGGSSFVAPVKTNMAPIYKLLLLKKRSSPAAPCKGLNCPSRN